ncbi:hypothetical protein C8F04DRAFT_1252603 [Mycena alexandri]|uniref:Uncharacterized protein n=1 Tax=Mycena alexandri TaxID=1745969 RepID=A0AAD6T9U8_9AGAR|nr:hypothetical protein C8F04DRAFT_1252603 [Mycena alexandri]
MSMSVARFRLRLTWTPSLPTTFSAYAAKVESKEEKRGSKVRRSLLGLLGMGFRIVKWDGRTPHPSVDCNGRIIAVLVGQPDHPEYRATANLTFEAIRDASRNTHFPAAMHKHCRGLFAAVNVSLSYGKGQSISCWLNNKEYTGLVEGLLANANIERLAVFADAAFALWAPHLYQYYCTSVFFCVALNFGRNVWTFKHCDVLNLAFGWCAVHALRHYNATLGGHLVLWDLKLVIEFPHGALILLPSATITHLNIPVQEGEERVSFTQFSAGGIFRYVNNGCKAVEGLEQADPGEYEQVMARMASRWREGLNLLGTVDELVTPEELISS